MAQRNGRLALAIEDRGRGLPDGDGVARGVGLVSMRERAELMGGTFADPPGLAARGDRRSRGAARAAGAQN